MTKISSIKRILFGSLLSWLLLAAPAVAQPLFYDDVKRGWFWYEDPPVEIDDKQEEQAPSPPARPTPSLQDYTMDELWDMHPDDFQDLLMALKKEAVRRPTEENVLDYVTIQDIARRKALAFANVAGYVTQKYPSFNVSQSYPISQPGVRARVQQQRHEISSVIAAARNDHALLFITNPECSFCTEQQQILERFQSRHGWDVKSVDIRTSPHLAAQFGVRQTPTLLLIKRNHLDHLTVASGVISLDALERKLFQSIRLLRGDITPEEFSMYEFQRGGAFDPGALLINNGR